MELRKTILRLLSYVIRIPIKIGEGLSFGENDSTIVIRSENENNLLYVKKYELRNTLGSFALVGIFVKKETTFYKLQHISTQQELILSKKSLDMLFNTDINS